MSRLLAVALLFLLPAVAAAQPAPPPPTSTPVGARAYFFGGSVGLGAILRGCEGCDNLGGGTAGLHAGTMLAPRTGLLIDVNIVSHPMGDESLNHVVLVVALQQYISGRDYLEAGLGGGALTIDNARGETVAQSDTGFALFAAVGREIAQGGRYAVDLQLRLATVAYGEASGIGNLGSFGLLLGIRGF
jgi:hypothetical protein